MKKGYDVIIIGGGIVGCATAFELAKRGITDVLLIEKGFVSRSLLCGVSFRSDVLVLCYRKGHRIIILGHCFDCGCNCSFTTK